MKRPAFRREGARSCECVDSVRVCARERLVYAAQQGAQLGLEGAQLCEVQRRLWRLLEQLHLPIYACVHTV